MRPDGDDSRWPEHLPVQRIRVARPTDRFEDVVHFYGTVLGLPRLGEFADHAGFDGVMFGLPGAQVHLEFTRHVGGSPAPDSDPDALLALYLPDRAAVERIARRLAGAGVEPVPPKNPWWRERAVTVCDPDGWRIALVDGSLT